MSNRIFMTYTLGGEPMSPKERFKETIDNINIKVKYRFLDQGYLSDLIDFLLDKQRKIQEQVDQLKDQMNEQS